jgi:hypothetical protein
MFGSLYKLYSSLFHLGRQHPPSCVGPYILGNSHLLEILLVLKLQVFWDLANSNAKPVITSNKYSFELSLHFIGASAVN